MKLHIYIILIHEYPAKLCDEYKLIFIKNEHDTMLDLTCADFLTTISINSLNPARVLDQFNAWWEQEFGIEFTLFHLTSDNTNINTNSRKRLSDLSDGEWSINTALLAYEKGNNDSKELALEIIRESELLSF
jgi:hypothetical protein